MHMNEPGEWAHKIKKIGQSIPTLSIFSAGCSLFAIATHGVTEKSTESRATACEYMCTTGCECVSVYGGMNGAIYKLGPDNITPINILHDLASLTFVWAMCVCASRFSTMLIMPHTFFTLASQSNTHTRPNTATAGKRPKIEAKKTQI